MLGLHESEQSALSLKPTPSGRREGLGYIAMMTTMCLFVTLAVTLGRNVYLKADFFGLMGSAVPIALIALLIGNWAKELMDCILFRKFPLDLLEKHQPGYIVPDAVQLAWVRFDNEVEQVVQWKDVTKALSTDLGGSKLTIYSGQSIVFLIRSEFTCRYEQLCAEIRRRLEEQQEQQAQWHTVRFSWVGIGVAITIVAFLFGLYFFLGYRQLPESMAGLPAWAITTPSWDILLSLFSILSLWFILLIPLILPQLAIADIKHPNWSIPLVVLGVGNLLLASFFWPPLVLNMGRLWGFALVCCGLWLAIWASTQILRSWYRAHALRAIRFGASSYFKVGFTIILMCITILLGLRIIAFEIPEYYHLQSGRSSENFEDQEYHLSQAVALKPNDPWAYTWRALSRFAHKDYREAVSDATTGLSLSYGIQKLVDDLYTVRAKAYAQLGESQLALSDSHRLFDISPQALTSLALHHSETGHRELALTLYTKVTQWALQTNNANYNNNVCWYGSLGGFASTVIPTCEHAVLLAPDNGDIRDSRGLARALLGDAGGAIEDFEFTLVWWREPTRSSLYSEQIIQREAWITALKSGSNPFDPATLEKLKKE